MTPFEMVVEFHKTFSRCPGPTEPSLDVPAAELRIELITEEFSELLEAFANRDLVGVADALADLEYVLLGSVYAFGIPYDEVFKDVHLSNMSKADVDGKPIFRQDGKLLKGPNFRPPHIAEILMAAHYRAMVTKDRELTERDEILLSALLSETNYASNTDPGA